jgi:hypothetical protein
MVHSSFPRIREFSYDKLRAMIRADKNYSKYLNANDGAPHGKVSVCTPVLCHGFFFLVEWLNGFNFLELCSIYILYHANN